MLLRTFSNRAIANHAAADSIWQFANDLCNGSGINARPKSQFDQASCAAFVGHGDWRRILVVEATLWLDSS